MAGRLYVGTSGFAYDAWKHGVFYPEGTKNGRMLEHYSSVLSSVEINYTFRRFPSESTTVTWRSQTPETFRFSLKANSRITHIKRLADTGADVALFAQRVAMLGDRLGPVAFKTPETLERDDDLLVRFADNLPPGMPAVMDFRHPSWAGVEELLAKRGVAVCVTDSDEQPYPKDGELPSDPFAYLRLRRSGYSSDDLEHWARRIDPVLTSGRDVYCYFRHEDTGTGPRWAAELRTLLEA